MPAKNHIQASEDEAARIAATLPDDFDGLLRVAKESVEQCNRAVLSGEMDLAGLASARYDASIWKLNGGTFFACRDVSREDSAAALIERHCSAAPGAIPHWGQLGEFMLTVQGVRCLVIVSQGWGDLTRCCLEFHAVDLDKVFISETGFRSEFAQARPGQSLLDAAAEAFAAFLAGRKRYVDDQHREMLTKWPMPKWLQELDDPPRRKVPDASQDEANRIPEGYVLVDVVLPSHQAFIVRKWAKQARSKMAAAKAAEKEKLRGSYSNEKVFRKGQRCVIDWEPREGLKDRLGKVVIVTEVNEELESVWAHDEKAVTYKKNRKGRVVVDHDPSCIQTAYSMGALRPLN